MRLIDADALMKELGITSDDCCECEWGDGNGYCTRTSDFTEVCDAICTALPIEIGRKIGEWVDLKCSICGQVDMSKPNFCPNCGADMRGEQDG